MRYAVVIPTIGRPCLTACLDALFGSRGPEPEEVVVVDDRPGENPPLDVPVRVIPSGGRGHPAGAGGDPPRHATRGGARRPRPGWRSSTMTSASPRPGARTCAPIWRAP